MSLPREPLLGSAEALPIALPMLVLAGLLAARLLDVAMPMGSSTLMLPMMMTMTISIVIVMVIITMSVRDLIVIIRCLVPRGNGDSR